MPKTTKGRLDRPQTAQEEQEARKHKALLRATRKLPASLQRYVREIVPEMPSPDLLLEVGIATLLAQQGAFLKVHDGDCKRYEANLKRAIALRESVAALPSTEPKRLQAEALALRLEIAKPNHAGAAKVTADLSDKIRKLSDSLAMHRPTGYSRVIIEMRTGEGEKAPWSSDPGDNLDTSYTQEDDEYIKQAEGDLLLDPEPEDPKKPEDPSDG